MTPARICLSCAASWALLLGTACEFAGTDRLQAGDPDWALLLCVGTALLIGACTVLVHITLDRSNDCVE